MQVSWPSEDERMRVVVVPNGIYLEAPVSNAITDAIAYFQWTPATRQRIVMEPPNPSAKLSLLDYTGHFCGIS